MSAGAFELSFYESNSGEIYNIRVQPETITGFNTPATGPATGEPSAIANGSRRRIGVNARKLRIRFDGTPPSGYKEDSVIAIPILTPTVWQNASKGDTVTYLGVNATVVGKTPEYIN